MNLSEPRRMPFALPVVVGLVSIGPFLMGTTVTAQEGRSPYYLKAGGPTGVGRYEPGEWGAVAVQLANPGEEPAEVLSTLSFGDASDMQFGRRIWMPARSRRLTWYTVRAPDKPPHDTGSWTVQSFLFDTTDDSETPIPATFGEMRVENILPVGSRKMPITGLYFDADSDVFRYPADQDLEYQLSQLLWAARTSRNFRKTFVILGRNQLPPTAESLDSLDQLVIAGDSILEDVAACRAIRDWTHRGGRLWLMLNHVEPSTMSRLAGDACQVTIVDRTERERFQIFSHDSRGTQPSGPEREFEHPVEMVRAILTGFHASHTVDGWPVAAWKTVGRGQLLVTTLDSRAWIRARTAKDPPAVIDDEMDEGTHVVATEPLRELAYEFMLPPPSPVLEPEDFRQVASEQIGYRIVSRGQVAGILGGFCLAIAAFGAWQARRGSLEHLGWIAPLAVVVVSGALLSVGRASRESIPRAIVVSQFVETSPHTDDVQISGLAATYSEAKTDDSLHATRGGVFLPAMEDHAGTVVRRIALDRDQWELRNLALPAGQQLIPFSASQRLEHPITATATFGPEGLAGEIASGTIGLSTDAVLAMPATRHLAMQMTGDGTFTVNADSVLSPGRFLTGNVISDEQRRRIDIYRTLFDPEEDRVYPDQATILVWANPLDTGFHFLDDAEESGSALMSIPLRIRRPEPGTRVLIPGPFVAYRAVGKDTSATFDARNRIWSGPFTNGLNTVLRFRVPEELLPLTVERATLTVDVRAPLREVRIQGLVDGEFELLESRRGPLEPIEVEITREEILRYNDDQELTLRIDVGDLRDDENQVVVDAGDAQSWKIDDVQLEITGITQEP